ncbi:uncharacterized protein G2W53_031325 [Senna tora]|uniref:Uncharacterized protein n=1 Tax=Senna tora TaxID=362788 RepID=A0A834WFF9_9FABA|nr:uncharacterized protein G2W53_031325 [Senna tora]
MGTKNESLWYNGLLLDVGRLSHDKRENNNAHYGWDLLLLEMDAPYHNLLSFLPA